MKDAIMSSTCCLCGKSCSHYAKSHLIPWGFQKKIDNAHKMSLVTGGLPFKRLPGGIYDEHILCDECEHRYFHEPDTYAINVYRDLKKNRRHILSSLGMECSFYLFEKVDRRLLRAFFASVLWRCSVSSLDCVKGVNIGKEYEQKIVGDLVHNGSFSYVDAVGVFFDLSAQDERMRGLNSGFMLPLRTHLVYANREANGYSICLPGVKFCVSLDQRENPFAALGDQIVACDVKFANTSPSLSAKYDNFQLMLFESEYPTSMYNQIVRTCQCARRHMKGGHD